ncbi:MAG: RDD family protein, partial [Gammaproteobacteria bacterium]
MHTATADTEIPSAVRSVTFASLGSRFVAQILDALAMFGVFFVVGSFFAMLFGGATEGGFELTGIAGGLFIAVEIVLVLGYFVICEARWGATLGKLAAGIRVQSTTGQRIGYGAALVRNLMRVVDMLPGFYLTGVISILLTKRKQRLGDLVADAVVVRPESGRGLRVAAAALA